MEQCWLLGFSPSHLLFPPSSPLGSFPLQPCLSSLPIEPLFEPIQLCHLVVIDCVHGNIVGHLVFALSLVGLGGNIEIDLTPVVASVFDSVLHGKGLTEIAKELNRKGIRGSRGKGWGKTGLHSILTNEVYAGTLVWGRRSKRGLEPIRVENGCPAIVDRETFNRVREQLKERAPTRLHPKRAASRFLLSGLARCGYCGKALIGQDAKSGGFSYYVCGSLLKKGGDSCPARYLNSSKFEGLVINKIKEHIMTCENLT